MYRRMRAKGIDVMKGRRTPASTRFTGARLARLQRRVPRAVPHARAVGHQRQAERAHAAAYERLSCVGRLVHRRGDRDRREKVGYGGGDAGQVLPGRKGGVIRARLRDLGVHGQHGARSHRLRCREPHRPRHRRSRRARPRVVGDPAVGWRTRGLLHRSDVTARRGGGRRRDSAGLVEAAVWAPTPSSISLRARTRVPPHVRGVNVDGTRNVVRATAAARGAGRARQHAGDRRLAAATATPSPRPSGGAAARGRG